MSLIFKILLGLAILIFGAAGALLYRAEPPSSYYLTGGSILTMDPSNPSVKGLLVEDGRISLVGGLDAILAKAPDAEKIDLKGGTLMPGLIEPHTHPLASALLGATVNVSGFRYSHREQIIEALEEAANGTSLTPWLVAYGWDPLAISDLEPPSLAELDRVSPDKPMIVLTQMLHEVFANSMALEAAGLDINNKEQQIPGFIRDDKGRLTGTVKEVSAIDMLVSSIPPAPAAATELLLRLQYIKYAKAGYTTIGVTGVVGRHKDPVGLLRKVGDNPESPLRTYLYLLPSQSAGQKLGGTADFSIKGMKFWMDGSPFTGGAALEGYYENSDLTIQRLGLPHNHTGDVNHTEKEFQDTVLDLHKKGYQIAVHAQGERAIDRVLVAIENAQRISPNPALRHRLEHNALITKDQMIRAQKLKMTTGFFVDHLYYYGDGLPDLMGAKRMTRYMPLNSAIKAGLKITVHGDHPATPIGPFRTFRTAVDRLSRGGTINGETEKITRLQALQAMTINAAYQLGEEAELGSFEVGKRADMVLLSLNPLIADFKALEGIEVQDIWKEGRPVDRRFVTLTHLSLFWDILKEKMLGLGSE